MTVSITFGTNDLRVRPSAMGCGPYTVVRVYESGKHFACQHKHTSRDASARCARKMAKGVCSCLPFRSFVAIVGFPLLQSDLAQVVDGERQLGFWSDEARQNE